MSLFLNDGLIVANPALSDIPKFADIANRMVYIVEHKPNGAFGVSINQSFSKRIDELLEILPIIQHLNQDNLITDKVLSGGPLANDIPWILSKNTSPYEKQMKNDIISVSFSQDAFEQQNQNSISICGIGSFGWGKGQIEKELANGLWHYFPTDEAVLNSIPFSDNYKGAVNMLLEIKYG